MVSRKRGLGKGISALMGSMPYSSDTLEADKKQSEVTLPVPESEYRQVPIEFLRPGAYQPRRTMAPDALDDLAQSIKSQGVMQPLIVRAVSDGAGYEIIAGERRWRASQIAGLQQVPCVIRDVSDEAALALAIIENIQREDLSPMEQAIGLQRLKTEFDLTHQQIADAVGRSRTSITNLLRLLHLHDSVKQMLDVGDLEIGHAKCLIALDPDIQVYLAKQVIDEGMSVRATEVFVKKYLASMERAVKGSLESDHKVDPDINLLQNMLAEKMGASVKIHHRPSGKGRLVINYTTLDELEGIVSHF